MHPSIPTMRERIDAIDDQLLALLADRMKIADELKPLKQGKIYDPAREELVRNRWIGHATTLGLSPEFATALLAIILAESKRRQS